MALTYCTFNLAVILVIATYIPSTTSQCGKPLLDECYGGLPKPFSLLSYGELTNLATEALNIPDLTGRLFSIPTDKLVNRTCAVYQGLKRCRPPIRRLCSPDISNQYSAFRESYDYLCGMIGRLSHLNNWRCLTNSTNLNTRVLACLNTYTETVIPMLTPVNGTLQKPPLSNKEAFCRARQALKSCSLNAVSASCGQYSREFWFQINFPHDRNLEAEYYCQDEVLRTRQLNESVWTVCEDGSNVIPYRYMCDKDRDCYNGQDEVGCTYINSSKSLPTSVIVGIIAGFIVFIIIIVCIVKCQQEAKYVETKRRILSSTDDDNGIEVKEAKVPLKEGNNDDNDNAIA